MLAIRAITDGLLEHLREHLGDLYIAEYPKDGNPTAKTAQGAVYVRFESLQAGIPEGIQYTDSIYVFALIVTSKDLSSEKGALEIVERTVNVVAWSTVETKFAVVRPLLASVDLIGAENGVWQYQVTVNIQMPLGLPRT